MLMLKSSCTAPITAPFAQHTHTHTHTQLLQAPACLLWLGLGAATLELPAMLAAGHTHTLAAHPLLFCASACMGFMVNILAFATIR